MHQHVAHPPGNDHGQGILDNISDTLLNAFTRVRKPDERFLSMREDVDKFEEGLVLAERLFGRIRGRTSGKFFLNATMQPVMVWGWMRWQPWIWWRSNCGLSWHGCCRSRSWILGIRYHRSTKPLFEYVARVFCAAETYSEIESSPYKVKTMTLF